MFCSLQNGEVSVFEINIRMVGGLLSMHSLTGNKVSSKVPVACRKLFKS